MNFKLFLWGFIIFSLFFYSYSRDLTQPDELKYVEVSREMMEKGNYLYPLYNYEPYFHKGPLYFYILLFFQKIFGENKFSFIFPSQLFSILILIIFYKFLKLFEVKEEEVLLSILILFSSIQFHFLSKAVRMDILLTFFIIFSYYLLFLKLYKDKKKLEIFFGLSFSLALLTKGPVSFIWFWAVPLIYAIFEREKRVFKFIFHPLSLLFSFLPVIVWFFLLYSQLGLASFVEIFQRQTMGRIHSSFAHKEPFHYYFYTLPLVFFPFTFFLPFSFINKKIYKENRFFIIWFFVPFIIFSLFSGKLSIYLLPLSFSVSLFLSKFLLSEKYFLKTKISIISSIVVFAAGLSLVYFNRYPEILQIIKNLRLLCLWFSITFLLLLFKNKYFPLLFCVFTLIFNILLSILIYPLTYQASLKELSIKYAEISKKQEIGYAFWDVKPSFLYYSRKKFVELHKNEEVEKELTKGNFIIIKEKNFNCLPLELKKKIKIEYKSERTGEHFYIISIPGQRESVP